MQDHVIIGRIVLMPVLVPSRSLHMDLDIPRPGRSVDLQPGIKKIRTTVFVVFTGMENDQRFSRNRAEFRIQQPVFPEVMQEFFIYDKVFFNNPALIGFTINR